MSAEKSKTKIYSVEWVDKDLQTGHLIDDYPLQRLASQWSSSIRDNFIARILNDYPIPPIIIAEQAPRFYLIDGKQRCTTAAMFRRGQFRIGKNIERPIVEYTKVVVENGQRTYKTVSFDIRKKGYKDLPDELKQRFDMYEFTATVFLDCSDEDLEYHIRSYNTCKPMTAAQKGITYIGGTLAGKIKELTRYPFFLDQYANVSDTDIRNGKVERMLTEALMLINFPNEWNKSNEKNSSFLKENLTDMSVVDALGDLIERLEESLPRGGKSRFFGAKDGFLFLALFDKFSKLGRDDDEFIDFLEHFEEMEEKTIDDTNWLEISSMHKSTKDKSAVEIKLDFLFKLMMDHLGVLPEIKQKSVSQCAEFFDALPVEDSDKAALAYIEAKHKDFLTEEEVDDLSLYADILKEWIEKTGESEFYTEENIIVLLLLVEEAVREDHEDLVFNWLTDFVKRYRPAISAFTGTIEEKYRYGMKQCGLKSDGFSSDGLTSEGLVPEEATTERIGV